ncbi:MAG TPA: TerC/Alx family metal homeostasis membrane protein [Microbacteriaceae bacterium]|nr:TerC/Alx family metal homeostasis membrane protein [Microbacteriaceae bacterium]
MHTDLPLWFETGSLVVLVLILVADLFLVAYRPHTPSVVECVLWIAFYVALALGFALAITLLGDAPRAGEFVAGWLTEYSLSIDNLFVFVLIMARFAVPQNTQQEVLMVGIVIALVLRGIFIVIGAGLIANFSWIFYLFGAFLLYTAARQVMPNGGDDATGQSENALTRFLRRRLRVSDQYEGFRLRTTVAGRRMLTPVLLVLVTLGGTDLLFALDSIPAIFGITTSPFIVFTANIFALMGLRQLYFLLGHLIDRLEYLKYGIAVILAFIGVKLVLHALNTNELPFIAGGKGVSWAPEIGTGASLAVIVGAMAAATGASLIRLRWKARRGA